MEFLFFSHILPPEWKTVCWCLVFAWLHNAWIQKKKRNVEGWGRGVQSRNQEFLPCLSLALCHPFVLYLRASTRKFTCGVWNLPEEGVALRHGGAGKGCGILSSVSCVHSLGERREEKFPSTDWLTEVRFYVSQCNVKWCDTRMMPPHPPAQIFFFLQYWNWPMKDATGYKWIKVQYPDLVSQL